MYPKVYPVLWYPVGMESCYGQISIETATYSYTSLEASCSSQEVAGNFSPKLKLHCYSWPSCGYLIFVAITHGVKDGMRLKQTVLWYSNVWWCSSSWHICCYYPWCKRWDAAQTNCALIFKCMMMQLKLTSLRMYRAMPTEDLNCFVMLIGGPRKNQAGRVTYSDDLSQNLFPLSG